MGNTAATLFVLVSCVLSLVSGIVPPAILEAAVNLPRLEIIKHYFFSGLSYAEIVLLLFVIHEIKISLRQLKRILRANGLCRNRNYSSEDDIKTLMSAEIENSGKCIGYRSMWRRLVNDHHVRVPRDKVLRYLREIDPEGVRRRKSHRLVRRKYYARGPNFVWHVDGYDKLKPYGFCIHGAMDGYSRRILWLEVANTNNSSTVIAKYYLDALRHLGICPRLLRSDRGTENVKLSVLQPFFRVNDTDRMAGLRSFMYGKSVSNQRIESWWGILRRQGVQWWMCFFKDMQDLNVLDTTNALHVECLRYCFMHVLQAELDRIVEHWNLHEIRSQKNSNTPSGKPEMLYFVPEVFGGQDHGHNVDLGDVEACYGLYSSPKKMYSEDIEELANLLLPAHQQPTNTDDAYTLYRNLLREIERFS